MKMKTKTIYNNPDQHHPYCVYTYNEYKRIRPITGWKCCCDLVKEYDKWRHKKQNQETEI